MPKSWSAKAVSCVVLLGIGFCLTAAMIDRDTIGITQENNISCLLHDGKRNSFPTALSLSA